MGVLQRGAAGHHDRAGGGRREAGGGEAIPDGAARELLHHDEAEALALDVVEDRDDVRVGQAGQGARLGGEALAHLGLRRERRRQLLDGDAAVEAPVATEVDDAHAAAPDLALDVVVGDRLGDPPHVGDLGGPAAHDQEPTSTRVTRRSAWASVSWWPVTTARNTRRSMARSTRSVVGDHGRLPGDVAEERDLAEAARRLLEVVRLVGDDDLGPARLDHVEEVAGVALLEHDLAGRRPRRPWRCRASRSIDRSGSGANSSTDRISVEALGREGDRVDPAERGDGQEGEGPDARADDEEAGAQADRVDEQRHGERAERPCRR